MRGWNTFLSALHLEGFFISGGFVTRSVWWEDGAVKMIDQRVLPQTFEIVSYKSDRSHVVL